MPRTTVLAARAGSGQRRHGTLPAPGPDVPRPTVAMIQASITNYEQLRQEIGAYGVVRKVLDTHYELSWSALRDHGADVLLWSETVYPTTFASPRSEDGAVLDREIQGFVDAAGVPLVFGTYDLDDAGEYNAAAFLEPGRGLLGFYRKATPFPLTEYVPAWLDHAWVRRLLPWAGGWRPGPVVMVLLIGRQSGNEKVKGSGKGGLADTARGLGGLLPGLPLRLGIGMQRQRMDGPCQLLCQHAVDLTMAPQQALPLKSLAHHYDLEVAL